MGLDNIRLDLERRAFLSALGSVTAIGTGAVTTDSAVGDVAASSASYAKGNPVLQTRWFDEVGPDNALPRYPRPRLRRDRWLNINGLWGFEPASAGESPPFGQSLSESILVPYPVESALSGIHRHENRMWYRTTFQVPSNWSGRTLLHIERADWEATVYVNGTEVGSHRGGYDSATYDVTPHLSGGDEELIVNVYDPTDGGTQAVGKQELEDDDDIFFTPASGIWGTVWLEPVPDDYVQDVQVSSNANVESVGLTVDALCGNGYTVEARAYDDGLNVPLSAVDATPAGDATFDRPNRVIDAAGADVWTSADEYGTLASEAASGDVVARTTVESQEDTGHWAKAGIMIANDIAAAGASAGDVCLHVAPGGGPQLTWDSDGDGYVDTAADSSISGTYPIDLRLTKQGSTFTGEYSTDGGASWTTLGSADVGNANSTQDVGLYVTSQNAGTKSTAEFADFSVNRTQIASVSGRPNESLALRVSNPTLWSPGEPKLYDLDVDLKDGSGSVVDSVSSYFGIRSLGTKVVDGTLRPTLNGEFVFHNGIYDQGYWPDGIYTPPTDEALLYDLQLADDLGFNTYRKHIKTESKRWYYYTDRLGFLVWHDVPNQPLGQPGANEGATALQQFRTELQRIVDELDDHPSMAVWQPVNEGWGHGKTNTDRMAEAGSLTEELDGAERVVDTVSGVNTLSSDKTDETYDPGNGDVIDYHTYMPDYGDTSYIPSATSDRIAAVGESSAGWTPPVVQDVGLYVCGNGSTITGDFGNVSFNWSVADDRWHQVDTTAAGDATFDESTLTVSAAGSDVWTSADEYGALTVDDVLGDFEVTVTIQDRDTGSTNSKVGLMIANDAAADGSSVGDFCCHLVENDGLYPEVTWDSDEDGYVDSSSRAGAVSLPVDLRITKSGDTYTGEYSTDGGSTWTEIASAQPAGAGNTKHQWGVKSGAPPVEIVSNLERRATRNEDYMKNRGLSGAINLQTTDTEYHYQGVVTYDRDVFKVGQIVDGVADVRAANQTLVDASKALGSETLADETGYWPADEASGSTAGDEVAGNDLSLNGATWTTGAFGTALQFDGTDDEADAGASVVDTSGSFTVSARVKLDQIGGAFQTAVSQEGGSSSQFFLQYDGNNGVFRFAVDGASGPAEGGPTVEADRWYHVVGRVAADANETALFVDGEKVASASGTSGASSGNTIVGRATYDGSPVDFFGGAITDVRTFDGALRDDHVAQLHALNRAVPYREFDATPAANATFDQAARTIDAAGADVWTSADEYGTLAKESVTGDVVARTTVESQENTGYWAKAGVMIANDVTAPGSSAGDVCLHVAPGGGPQLTWDSDGDGYVDTAADSSISGTYPVDLRLTKRGTTFTGEYSTDGGTSWTTLGSADVSDANRTQDVGLYVSSQNAGTKSTADFSGFVVR